MEFFNNDAHHPPKFGPLQGVKVVFSAVQVAGPLGPHLMAEWGADVIWLESTRGGDPVRYYRPAEVDHRNDRSMSLDIFAEEGLEVFKKLIAEADIFLVSGKGPAFIRKGITDEFLWEINPKLVIARVAGYGQEDAHPDYLNRACFDGIAQAMSGFLIQNGTPETPIAAYPYCGDLFTALYTGFATMAALTRARETGEGESIDIAMTEVLLRLAAYNMIQYLNDGQEFPRAGEKDPIQGGNGIYKTKDGFLYVAILGVQQMKDMFELIGCSDLYGTGDFEEGFTYLDYGYAGSREIEAKLCAYFKTKTSAELIEYMDEHKMACAPVLTMKEVREHPQYKARDMWVNWETMTGKENFEAMNIVPRFKKNPAKIWRSMPHIGYDNDAILTDLGYDPQQINELYEKGVIYRADREN